MPYAYQYNANDTDVYIYKVIKIKLQKIMDQKKLEEILWLKIFQILTQ